MIEWTIQKRKLSKLTPHSKNPRRLSSHDAEHLQRSLEKFGLIDKPIINKDNVIIGGHQRVSVLKQMGVKEVECYVPSTQLEPKDVDELCIRLNRNLGEWDHDLLANQWDFQDILDWGFTEEELLDASIEEIAPQEEDETSLDPGKDEDAITKLGDVYDLGEHRLVCGDSTNADVVSLCLNGKEPILMVTDPPYGVEYDPEWRSKAGKGCKAKGKVQNDDRVNWSLAWSLFPGSVAYIWHSDKFCFEVQKSLFEADYEVISQIIWVKQHFALSRGDYHWQHEPCWYAVKKGDPHNWQGARDQSTTWEISNLNAFGTKKEDERTSHSTQKPLECMSRPIRNNSMEGDEIYDPFLGSGTTLLAAEQTKRICYGIELSAAYCDLIVKRWIRYRKKGELSFEVRKNGKITKEFNC